jgi:vacuolar iron transporter family protein
VGLAEKVAEQLMARDALEAHARDELGISPTLRARRIQAAIASAASFTVGAVLPLSTAAIAPHKNVIPAVAVISLLLLGLLGSVAARVGGASLALGAARVLFWGALAMGVTAGVGALFETPM